MASLLPENVDPLEYGFSSPNNQVQQPSTPVGPSQAKTILSVDHVTLKMTRIASTTSQNSGVFV